jgi:hypothetical protein
MSAGYSTIKKFQLLNDTAVFQLKRRISSYQSKFPHSPPIFLLDSTMVKIPQSLHRTKHGIAHSGAIGRGLQGILAVGWGWSFAKQ